MHEQNREGVNKKKKERLNEKNRVILDGKLSSNTAIELIHHYAEIN